MTKYQIELDNLKKACDISIEVYTKFPSKDWSADLVNWFIKCALDKKEMLSNRQAPFNTLASLKYDYEAIFTFFQESSGLIVEEFWNRIKKENLPYKRENKLKKILKRKRIANDIEFDFVTDVLVPYIQEGLITQEEELLLKQYLGDFELKAKKK